MAIYLKWNKERATSSSLLPRLISSILLLLLIPRNNGVLSAFWYVTGKRDVADFYVVIRHINSGEIVYESTVPYNKRSVAVAEREGGLRAAGMDKLQLCIIAKRSNHELGYWTESQCVRLSEALRESSRGFYSTTSGAGGILSPLLMHLFLVLLLHLSIRL